MLFMSFLTTPSHIIVGLSGGVDSSVAAYLLKKQGHHVEAVFMQNWQTDRHDPFCTSAEDFEDAQLVCEKLNIPLKKVNFAEEYWRDVFEVFLSEYRAGKTPNPDILCNKNIKFKTFLDYAKKHGADYIATGHYARIDRQNSVTQLLKACDLNKDQSYFLHALSPLQLSQSLFPLGELKKESVRHIAKELGLINHAKKDSTGICFIGERKFNTFLNDYLIAEPGPIQTLEGEHLGYHQGLIFYTIGQRQGLQIGGKKNKATLPWYVAAKDTKKNLLTVVQGESHPALFKSSLIAKNVHWMNHYPPLSLHAKTRYRQTDQACHLKAIKNNDYIVRFDQPQRALTPGQAIVFYQGDICLGGGIIEMNDC